jgi:DNA modification methylase
MKLLQKQKSNISIKCGQIYGIGMHVLGCGDARDTEFVNYVIGKNKIKAAIVDPPYGTKTVESKLNFNELKKSKIILNDDITSELEYVRFTEDWLKPLIPHLAAKNSLYIFNSDAMIFALREAMENVGVHFSQLLIWVKSQAIIGRKDFLPMHELLAHGWVGKHQPLRAKDKSVIFCPKPHKNLLHPTQKPVALIRRLILNSTLPGDTLYDCFSGSSTLGVAAEQTFRKSILIERDEEYCLTTIKRFERLFNIKAKLLKK